jgi:cytochrome c oxidase cbb3-type subunit 3
MCSPYLKRTAREARVEGSARILLCIFLLAGCNREDRSPSSPSPTVHEAHAVQVARVDRKSQIPLASGYKESAYAISQGQQLFGKFNCVGCHAHGGGGMGPALMDSTWIYGAQPSDIFTTIVEGRPNGMPSFGGAVTSQQILQLTAYVRTLSGNAPKDAIPSRSDEIMSIPARNVVPRDKPAR